MDFRISPTRNTRIKLKLVGEHIAENFQLIFFYLSLMFVETDLFFKENSIYLSLRILEKASMVFCIGIVEKLTTGLSMCDKGNNIQNYK